MEEGHVVCQGVRPAVQLALKNTFAFTTVMLRPVQNAAPSMDPIAKRKRRGVLYQCNDVLLLFRFDCANMKYSEV